MFWMKSARVLTLGTALLLSACSLELQPKVDLPKLDLNLGNAAVSCSAIVEPGVGSAVPSGVPVPINITAKGGNAPYTVLNTAIGFDSSTAIARTYTNNSAVNVFKVDTVSVRDSLGLVGQCNFVVTVAPANGPSSDLACQLQASPATAPVNANFTLAATAQGGSAPYVFSNLTPQAGGSIVTALSATNATQAVGVVRYSTAGLRTPSVTLTDATGTQVACSTSVDVGAAAALSVAASPSATVQMGSSITLTAQAQNLGASPTFSFSTLRAGVSISSNGPVATVTSATAQSAFDVTVTAHGAGQTVTKSLSLTFINPSPSSLACSIQFPTGILYKDANVPFEVVSTTGEALEITYFATHSDGTVQSQTASSRTIRYTAPGVKTVLMQARAPSTGALCQAGAVLSATVEITEPAAPPLTCSGFSNFSPSYTWEWFTAWATISGGQSGVEKWVSSIDVLRNGQVHQGLVEGYWVENSSTHAKLRIWDAGTYTLRFTVRDTSGNTGTCTKTHIVWNYWY